MPLTPEACRAQREWLRELNAAGFAVPHWPREWGGGRSQAEQLIIHQELRRAKAPDLSAYVISLHHLPGTLLAHGTEAQQREHLAGVLDGTIWCQGFSEPEAGSDLAALRTVARRRGADYVITGQKIWATVGLFAQWCLLLARTDSEKPKRKGITCFLVDMRSPGVEVRGIRQATGATNFAEIFLDDVVVPAANVVGDVDDGWKVAQTTLATERGPILLEFSDGLSDIMADLTTLASTVEGGGVGAADNTAVLDRLAVAYEDAVSTRLLCDKVIDQMMARGAPGPESSIVKLRFSEVAQSLTRLAVSLGGLPALVDADEVTAGRPWFLDHLDSWEFTISGGTNEIQRNLIGERVLGLPRDPSMV